MTITIAILPQVDHDFWFSRCGGVYIGLYYFYLALNYRSLNRG